MLASAIGEHGAPERVVTDRGGVFRSALVAELFAAHGVTHTLTRPCHPWTNGRVERLFRTLDETVRGHFWLVASAVEWASICRDFRVFYNDHRPHQAYGGRTPSEVHRGISAEPWTGETITFFARRMRWWRFG